MIRNCKSGSCQHWPPSLHARPTQTHTKHSAPTQSGLLCRPPHLAGVAYVDALGNPLGMESPRHPPGDSTPGERHQAAHTAAGAGVLHGLSQVAVDDAAAPGPPAGQTAWVDLSWAAPQPPPDPKPPSLPRRVPTIHTLLPCGPVLGDAWHGRQQRQQRGGAQPSKQPLGLQARPRGQLPCSCRRRCLCPHALCHYCTGCTHTPAPYVAS
jgi:hypothetical protein